MTTKRDYERARKQIKQAQNEAADAQREGSQRKLDAAVQKGAKALAVIAAYKNEQAQKAAATLGHMTSKRKAAASRANGKLGGRPKKA